MRVVRKIEGKYEVQEDFGEGQSTDEALLAVMECYPEYEADVITDPFDADGKAIRLLSPTDVDSELASPQQELGGRRVLGQQASPITDGGGRDKSEPLDESLCSKRFDSDKYVPPEEEGYAHLEEGNSRGLRKTKGVETNVEEPSKKATDDSLFLFIFVRGTLIFGFLYIGGWMPISGEDLQTTQLSLGLSSIEGFMWNLFNSNAILWSGKGFAFHLDGSFYGLNYYDRFFDSLLLSWVAFIASFAALVKR